MGPLRLDPISRRKMIIDAAVKAAEKSGLLELSHAETAALCAAPTSEGTVRRYFHTAAELREAVEAARK